MVSTPLQFSNDTFTGTSISLPLASGYSLYLCGSGSYQPYSITLSGTLDSAYSGNFAVITHQTSNICSATYASSSSQSIAGIGLNAASYSLIYSGNSLVSPSSTFTYNVPTTSSTSNTIAIMIASGDYPLTNVAIPAGCSELVYSGKSAAATAYIALCPNQGPGTYSVSLTGSGAETAYAVYDITPSTNTITLDSGQSTLTANPNGGTTPYSYQWYTASAAGTCSASDTAISGATSNTYTASPSTSTYYCYSVTDSALPSETSYSQTDLIAVNNALSFNSFLISNSPIDVGQSTTFTANVNGGTSPYTYHFLVYNSINGIIENYLTTNSLTYNSFVFTPNSLQTGSLTANVFVTDSASDPETVNSIINSLTINPQLFSGMVSTPLQFSNDTFTGTSISLPLASGYSLYLCGSGSYQPYSITLSGTLDSAYSGNFAVITHQTSNICSATYASSSSQSIAGIGLNAASYSLIYSGNSLVSPSSTFTYNVPTTSSTSNTIAIMIASGDYPLTNVAIPAGCSELVYSGKSAAATAYIALCPNQGPGTYSVSLTGSGAETAYAVYDITPSTNTITLDSGQSTLTANPNGGTTPYSYQWYTASAAGTCSASDTAISGATSNTYTASPGTSTYYCYSVTDSALPSETSYSQTDLLAFPLSTSITPNTPISIEPGQSNTITMFSYNGVPPYSYSWTDNAVSGTCAQFPITSTASSYIFTPNTIQRGCTWQFTGTVKDSATPLETSSLTTANIIAIAFSGTITYNSPTTQSYNGSNKVKTIFNVTAGSAPFTFNIIVYNLNNQIITQNNLSSNNENVILTTNALPVGVYNVNSIMSNDGVDIFATNSLTISKATPSITLPNFPANFVYNGNTVDVTANIVSVNNQLLANDFLNGNLIGSFATSNIISVGPSAGNYIIVTNTLGNGNYLPASVTNSLTISKATPSFSFEFNSSSKTAILNTSNSSVNESIQQGVPFDIIASSNTVNNQLAATLFVDGVFNTSVTTSNTLSFSDLNVGVHTFVFNSIGNNNYTSFNSVINVNVSPSHVSGAVRPIRISVVPDIKIGDKEPDNDSDDIYEGEYTLLTSYNLTHPCSVVKLVVNNITINNSNTCVNSPYLNYSFIPHAGVYKITAFSRTASRTLTLTIYKGILNATVKNPFYANSSSSVNVSFVGTPTFKNQSPWFLYVNGVLYGKTNSTITWNDHKEPGTYHFEFMNPGNLNYTEYHLNTILVVSGKKINSSETVNTTISKGSPVILNFTSALTRIIALSHYNATNNISLDVSNVTNIINTTPKNYKKIVLLKINSSLKNITLNITTDYKCGNGYVAPFIFSNDSWGEIHNYSLKRVNKTYCSVSVLVPDIIIGIFNSTIPPTISTTIPTTSTVKPETTVPTSIISTIPTTTLPSNAIIKGYAISMQEAEYIIAFAIIIVAAAVIAALLKNRLKKPKAPLRHE